MVIVLYEIKVYGIFIDIIDLLGFIGNIPLVLISIFRILYKTIVRGLLFFVCGMCVI